MRIRVRGTEYELDDDRLTVAEARLLKKYTRMGVVEIFSRLKKGDPDSMAALVFLAKLRAGESPKWRDLDELDIVGDIEILGDEDDEDGDGVDEDDDADDIEDEEPDPT